MPDIENTDERLSSTSGSSVFKTLIELIVIVAVALGLAYLVTHYVAQPYEIPSGSMEDTIQINDRVLSEKLTYYTASPKQGDIVTFIDTENPTRTLIKRVIAVGGGAIMDLCKLLGCKRPTSVHELYFKREPVVHEKEVIAIPTTCGTGSEVTNISVAIVKDEKDGKLTGGDTKLGLVSDDIIPNKVCLVPDLLKTLPYKPFAASAIDALIHATESFLSPHRKTVTSEMFSVKAMEMILEGFRRIALEGPDARMDYLGEFVHASLFAGIAFLKAGCATVHGMSFPLGGTYHVPHGESNYALFGKILEMYDEYEPAGELGKFKEIVARCLGCTKEDALRTLNVTLEKVLHLKPLHEYGFKEEDVKAFALSVDANQQRLITNSYRPWSIELSERVYKECF